MKSLFYTVVLVLIVNFTFTIENCMCQWQPDVRLTNNTSSSQTSLSNAWSIATSGNILHVVWEDNRDGNTEIYYKRSIDGGINWEADIRLTNNSAVSNQTSIAVRGLFVHVVWSDSRDGQYEIYYKRSTDAGLTWGADIRLSALDYFYSAIPSIAVSGSVVSVVWEDRRLGYGIFYKGSSDGGLSWGADKRLSDSTAIAARGEVSVAVSGLLVHVVWFDRRTDPNGEIYYKRSSDGGVSWSSETRLTNNPNYSFAPSVSVSGSIVHIVWTDNRDGFNQIYYKRSMDGGINWGLDTRLTYSVVNLYHANISTSASNIHIVWRDVTTGFTSIYYKRSTDEGVSWGSDLQLINYSSHSVSPSVAVSGSNVNVVWSDDRDGNYEVYYKRDTTGNPVSTFQSQYSRNNLNKPIIDNLNTLDTITVDQSLLPANYYVYDVNLKIDTVIHTNDSDLEFYLIHNGVTDTAIYQAGGSGDNFINTILNDSATTPIGSGSAPFSGSFRPHKPLSQFNGHGINGTWILKIYDRATGNTGTLNAWSLNFLIGTIPIGVTPVNTEFPKSFSLSQNYPNPFNPTTNIKFELPNSGFVKLTIYDMLGREIETLVNENLNAGTYNADWSAEGGAVKYSSGVYFYKLNTNDFSETRKMVLVK